MRKVAVARLPGMLPVGPLQLADMQMALYWAAEDSGSRIEAEEHLAAGEVQARPGAQSSTLATAQPPVNAAPVHSELERPVRLVGIENPAALRVTAGMDPQGTVVELKLGQAGARSIVLPRALLGQYGCC